MSMTPYLWLWNFFLACHHGVASFQGDLGRKHGNLQWEAPIFPPPRSLFRDAAMWFFSAIQEEFWEQKNGCRQQVYVKGFITTTRGSGGGKRGGIKGKVVVIWKSAATCQKGLPHTFCNSPQILHFSPFSLPSKMGKGILDWLWFLPFFSLKTEQMSEGLTAFLMLGLFWPHWHFHWCVSPPVFSFPEAAYEATWGKEAFL